MNKDEIDAMANHIYKVAKELIKENKNLEDLVYCKGFPDTIWICDCCGKLLNLQKGFENAVGTFECKRCGYINQISKQNVCNSPAEYERRRRQRMA